ncbi:YncE family protein [Brevibacterium atlanticum]|uniref:hypothetical protein n=1 Tax=Brevibacterium atlanticum TaxID=2697563 RepID=UPI0014216759|nr:hypothetical protein [Brevibacterium atlanticum]
MKNLPTPAAASIVAAAALLVGCQNASPPTDGSDTGSATPHGYVEGAEEASEPQLRLSVSDSESGAVRILDLLSEETVLEVPASANTSLAGADDRYLYLADQEAGTVTPVDTGVWTVDHGDHKHYYRAEPTALDAVTGADPAHIVSAGTGVALFFDGEGRAKLLDRGGLGDGKTEQLGTIRPGPHHGVAVPFEDHLISTVPGESSEDLPSSLAVYDEKGAASPVDEDCAEIHGAGVTREGPAFACAEGLMTFDEELSAELVPYPDEADGSRAWSVEVGRDLAAAPLDDHGIGLFDAKSGGWTYADTGAEVVAASVAGDDSAVVALDADGTAYSIDPESGEAEKKNLIDVPNAPAEGHGAGPDVVVDRERTYVSDPSSGAVLELDQADGLREARSFDVGGTPAALAVTGR